MINSKIGGYGYYVPEKVVTNHDLEKLMDTSDAWIQERTGIVERRFGKRHEETTVTMGAIAAERAIQKAGISKDDIDFIIFATLSPDYYFPGCGVLVQRELGMTKTEIGAMDVRNQCTGFVYGLATADQFVKSGMYKNVLVIGSEFHSMGLDFTTRGRDVAVIFGDGAGAVVVEPCEEPGKGILSNVLHSDGTFAEKLSLMSPGAHGGYHTKEQGLGIEYKFTDNEYESILVNQHMLDNALLFPVMEGQFVFKFAVKKFPEAIMESLAKAGLGIEDLDILIPHQANLRISQFVQRILRLKDEQIINNIQKYGNTTAASIPIAFCEAMDDGRIKEGNLVSLAAFGSGFTWGANLIRI